MDSLPLSNNPSGMLPQQGFVDIYYDRSSNTMRAIDWRGDNVPFSSVNLTIVASGNAVLDNGSLTIQATGITETSAVIITRSNPPMGELYEDKSARIPGESFTIVSTEFENSAFSYIVID